MKTHLVFNMPDKPEQMGQMQLVSDMKSFLSDRKEILPDAKVSEDGKRLFFTKLIKEDGSKVIGFAILTQVDDDFQNA